MKLNRIVLGLALAGICAGASAAENLFATASNRLAYAEPGELLAQVASDPSNERIELVSVRADLINEATDSVLLNLPGGVNITAKMTQFERMESGNEVWTGQLDMGSNKYAEQANDLAALSNNIIVVRSGDTLLANIRVAGQLYRLVPVDRGAHALIEVDQSKFLPDETEEAYAEMASVNEHSKEVLPDASRAIDTIRVMVAFGPAATSAIGNEQQAVDLAFAEANQALAATNTEARFQQAGAIQFYTQSETTNYSTMLSRLTNLSDGFYDAIGGQRNTNAADLVAYFAPSSSTLCGQAAAISATSTQAYFVMSPNCISGNYTFVHEAGHLVGARHDNDPTLSPFSYGHGYVITSQNRRTVMAVNNGPCSTCTRIGAFSSPNNTINGVPIGTTTRNDNTRVWRTRKLTVAGFR